MATRESPPAEDVPVIDLEGRIDHLANTAMRKIDEANAVIRKANTAIERLNRQDEVHWKTRRSLLDEIERLSRQLAASNACVEQLQGEAEADEAEIERLRDRLDRWYETEATIRGALKDLVGDDVYLKAIEKVSVNAAEHNPRLGDDVSVATTEKS